MEDVIEYNFSTEPDWISDAIEFTDTGIELNFKKLNCLCGQGALPRRLCIILEGALGANNFLANSREQPTKERKDHLSEVLLTDIKPDKVNGGWVKDEEQQSSATETSSSTQTANNTSNFLTVPKEKNRGKGVQRSESVLAREIRLQKERESEVKTERQQALRQLRRNQLRRERNASDVSSLSNLSSDDSHSSLKDIFPPSRLSSHQNSNSFIEFQSHQHPVSNVTKLYRSQTPPAVNPKTGDDLHTDMTQNDAVASITEQLSANVLPRSSPKLLTTVQRRVISEKAKQSESQSTVDVQTKPKSRREILRSRIQMCPVTEVDVGKSSTAVKHQEAATATRLLQNSRETQRNGSQPTYNDLPLQRIERELTSVRERTEELRNFGVKV